MAQKNTLAFVIVWFVRLMIFLFKLPQQELKYDKQLSRTSCRSFSS
jgi:hypothetical protein